MPGLGVIGVNLVMSVDVGSVVVVVSVCGCGGCRNRCIYSFVLVVVCSLKFSRSGFSKMKG